MKQVDSTTDTLELKLLFASATGAEVDQHFGSTLALYSYRISTREVEFLSCRLFKKEAEDGNEDKLKTKLAALSDADILYCRAMGPSASKQTLNLGVWPVRLDQDRAISDIICGLQAQLAARVKVEAWLQSIILKKQRLKQGQSRFETYEAEGWV
ncbi:NifB/NifX family molybdenum-iron cluster-binding protein [Agaribacterium sp. ZY112]|uniref:NifB/NifX family molybdenum-iron cluster-binding protein n=1 Tax=Agaribacterium sp. ZY112 TaxID=3233574 RepID=UPI0035266998